MPWPFPTPPLELLSAEGGLTPLTERRGGRPCVLLARELCSFERFEPPGGRASADRAAQLYARAHAPFHDPGLLLRRDGGGYAIWWWDRERIEPWLAQRFGAARPPVAPETLAQPKADGWRVVRLANGFELQCWRSGALVGSAWRPTMPDDAAWLAFTRQQRGAVAPPPSPPAPQSLPAVETPDIGGRWTEVSPTQTLKLGLTASAALMAVTAAFWVGQGVRLDQLSAVLERQAAAERAATVAPPDRAALRRQVAAYQALGDRPDVIAGLKAAMDVLRRHHLTAKAFSVDGQVVSVSVPYAALSGIAAITLDLQSTGAFSDVRPLPDSAEGAIEIRMTVGPAAPVSPAG